jgi:dienelactone hydrolase
MGCVSGELFQPSFQESDPCNCQETTAMLRSTLLLFLLGSTLAGFGQTHAAKDVDISAPDGVKLRATYFSAARPGPGVLLLHMCNTTRKSWEPVAKELSQNGINALTIDNRGFGESGGPRFEGGTPEVQNQLREKWAGDFDAAYQFLASQPGVDKNRIGAGGGSCGVNNAVKLSERHPDIKTLVLLAGPTDVAGINYILQRPNLPIFTAAAADDEYISAAPDLMQWFSEISRNPRSKFEGFKDGRHGTEIFGPHPELVHDIVAFFEESLSPHGSHAFVLPRKTAAAEFWSVASQTGGGARATQMFHDARKKDPRAYVFPEFPVNLLGYDRVQSGDKEDAIALFKLNAEAYPASANAQDSLSDGYMAAGQNDLALVAEKKCLELLPGDANGADFKAQLRKQAEGKIEKLKGSK